MQSGQDGSLGKKLGSFYRFFELFERANLNFSTHTSSIWAPQPRAYNIGGASSKNSSKAGTSRKEPIIEGDEADEEFLPRQNKAPLLTKIRE